MQIKQMQQKRESPEIVLARELGSLIGKLLAKRYAAQQANPKSEKLVAKSPTR